MTKLSVFTLPPGPNVEPGSVRGYYVDIREKALEPSWPPPWFPFPGFHRYIAIGQWGLAAYERFLEDEDGAWLEAAVAAADFLVGHQQQTEGAEGCWPEPEAYPHTFQMQGPWLSAMAQGHCASLLVRTHLAVGDPAHARAARLALKPMQVPTESGGAMAFLDGRPFPEEYPTTPPSYVLNGAIYALWGIYDVWRGLEDLEAGTLFADMVETFANNLHRWDTGYWSRYDLYPHPGTINIASASYHALHVTQLRALNRLAPHAAFAETADRFERYGSRALNRRLAFLHKGIFRVIVPRNHKVACRLPWSDAPHPSRVRPAKPRSV